MKKIFLKKLVLGFSAITILTYGVLYACSDSDSFWFFDSNFTPETFVDKSYSPLFLSPETFYEISFDYEHKTRFNDEIVLDWALYLDTKMDKKSTSFFLIESSEKEVAQLQAYYSTKKENATSLKWAKKTNLHDPKVKSFIEFLYYAQKIETVTLDDQWDYEAKNAKVFSDTKWIASIENKYNTTTDLFLKNRYWFQTIKAHFYSNKKQNAVTFFQKTQKTVPKNSLYYRALSYIAGIEYKQKHFAKANYLYSQVFDKEPKMRVVAAYCFHPQEQKDWKQSLEMAKNKDEKAALWAIQGYYGDETQAISAIYELKPESQHLDFLLTRLVNHQEAKIAQWQANKTVQQNKKNTKDSISKATIGLVLKIAQSKNIKKPYLWASAAGYLETLNGNFDQANLHLDAAQSTMPKTILAQSQIRLLRLINNLSKINTIEQANEKILLKDLVWLYEELPKKKIEKFRYQKAASWSKLYLAALYSAKTNVLKAELFAKNIDFYDNKTNLNQMKAFLSKENKTDFEKMALKQYTITLNDINEYQSVKATFENKIPQAITFIKQSNSLQKIKLHANPFNANIKDCHDCEHAAPQKKKYSKLDFLENIKTLQDNIAKGKDIYSNSINLGNAFYNITHFGNARIFYQGAIIGSGSTPYNFNPSTQKMITNCNLAKQYYQKAFAAAKTNEQKAKSQYMMAKCERNEFYNKKYSLITNWWDIEDDKLNFKAWKGFKKLSTNYSNTKYYKEVISECGYFKTYITQKIKK